MPFQNMGKKIFLDLKKKKSQMPTCHDFTEEIHQK